MCQKSSVKSQESDTHDAAKRCTSLQVRWETDPLSDQKGSGCSGEGNGEDQRGGREAEGYPWTRIIDEKDADVEGGSFMVCYKQFAKRQPAYILDDPCLATGMLQHPQITGGRPMNLLTALGVSGGGYHRSHGQLMDGNGAYTLLRDDTWLTKGVEVSAVYWRGRGWTTRSVG